MDLDIGMGHGELVVSSTESGRPRRHCKQPKRFVLMLDGETHLASVESQLRGRKRKADGSGTPEIGDEENDSYLGESDDQYNPVDSSDDDSDYDNSVVSDGASTGPALSEAVDVSRSNA